jgi:TIR domain
MPDTLPSQPITIFCSYARADEIYKDALKKALAVPLNSGEIIFWHDQLIVPGQQWHDEIKNQINSADIILLMLSSDFFASEYCQQEMEMALARYQDGTARVIPIICRSVFWENSTLGMIQALPKDAKPIDIWKNQDVAYRDVARGILRTIEEVIQKK